MYKFMALGMMLPGMISGYIQEWLGYKTFLSGYLSAQCRAFLLSIASRWTRAGIRVEMISDSISNDNE